jgi:hypothetical protein
LSILISGVVSTLIGCQSEANSTKIPAQTIAANTARRQRGAGGRPSGNRRGMRMHGRMSSIQLQLVNQTSRAKGSEGSGALGARRLRYSRTGAPTRNRQTGVISSQPIVFLG